MCACNTNIVSMYEMKRNVMVCDTCVVEAVGV